MDKDFIKVLREGYTQDGKVIVSLRALVKKSEKFRDNGTKIIKYLLDNQFVRPSGFTYLITPKGLTVRNSMGDDQMGINH
jgi:hypothetical protein